MTMRAVVCGVLLLVSLTASTARAADRPNVLFIAIDDLNDWIGPLGGHGRRLSVPAPNPSIQIRWGDRSGMSEARELEMSIGSRRTDFPS